MLIRLKIQMPPLRALARAGTIVAIAVLVLFGIGPSSRAAARRRRRPSRWFPMRID